MLNAYYEDSIENFQKQSLNEIIGKFTLSSKFDDNVETKSSWEKEISILKDQLNEFNGRIFFEFSIPRLGKRIDCLLIIDDIIFVLEFKVGESNYLSSSIDQVWDYALDLKNFHKPSHHAFILPVLVATEAKNSFLEIITSSHKDNLAYPVKVNKKTIRDLITYVLEFFSEKSNVIAQDYIKGSYSPTPTIIEAAVSLYKEHSVDSITRSDADAINLTKTTDSISEVIEYSKTNGKKVICFVTGVPGAGKTLVGLKVATTHLDKTKGNSSVYLSGNGPLVAILQEALTRDKVSRDKMKGVRITKKLAKQGVKAFIQIIHHYRDEYLKDPLPPYDHVAIFDEAQRAWNKEQTISFMSRKKGIHGFEKSEPEFLISCLDRHNDWAVIVCLVGGGQEINTGEAGISEWLLSIKNSFPHWEVRVSPNLTDKEYDASEAIKLVSKSCKVELIDHLHLSVSMRSFRAENVSLLVKQILDLDHEAAKVTFKQINKKYPILITRKIHLAKKWLKEKARGNERYGIVVSSQAQRLKPLAIDVKSPMDPVNWFLEGKDDVRSSYYLEDVATEFHVQGLELDWACVTWDGDFRFSEQEWKTFSFVGNKWQNIHKVERKKYLLNAYRVLLTRARQGMVIVIPEGNEEDPTRCPEFYNPTFHYLQSIGFEELV